MNVDSNELYTNLIGCIEHPDSQWRRTPRSALSEPARIVRLGVDVLGTLDRLGWGADIGDVLALIFRTPSAELHAMDDALKQLGAVRIHWLLAVLVGQLRFPGDGTELSLDAAIDKAAARPGLGRVYGRILSCTDELARQLWNYIREHSLGEGLQFREVVRATNSAAAPELPALRSSTRSNPRIVILRWEREGTANLIDAWLDLVGGAFRFSPQGSKAVARINDCEPRSRRGGWHFNMPDAHAIGVARAWHGPPSLSVTKLIDRPESYLAALLAAFEWVLVPMMNIGRQCVLAFVSENQHLQHRFLQLADTPRFCQLLIGFHQDPHLLGSNAQGAQFGERDQFGQAALIAAESDGSLPLLVAHLTEINGYWWTSLTEQCKCLAIRRLSDPWNSRVIAVYRAANREVFLAL